MTPLFLEKLGLKTEITREYVLTKSSMNKIERKQQFLFKKYAIFTKKYNFYLNGNIMGVILNVENNE